MIIFFLILGLIIAIIVLSVQYFKTYARLKSHSTFNAEAARVLNDVKYKDPKISCDFCGGQIDTRRDKVCPNCGASYAYDSEWLERHQILDANKVSNAAEFAASREIEKVQMEANEIARKLRLAIFVLVGILLFFLGIGIFLYFFDSHDFVKANKLNKYESDNFIAADYDIDGDGVIVDQNGFKLTLEGIYVEKLSTGKCQYRLGYHIENNSDMNLKVAIRSCAVNYSSYEDILYEWVKKGTDIIYYDSLYCVDDYESIEKIVYHSIELSTEDYQYTYKNDTPVVISTTGPEAELPELPTEGIVFENEDVLVTSEIDRSDFDDSIIPHRFLLRVYNKSEHFFQLTCNQGMVNRSTVDINGCYREPIYDFCTYRFSVYSYDEAFEKRLYDDKFLVNLSFSCKDDPALDFSTGYVQVN